MSPSDEAEATKACPACGAEVLAAAAVCKECRHRFGQAPGANEEPLRPVAPEPHRSTPLWLLLAGLITALLVAFAVSELTGSNEGSSGREAAPGSSDFTPSEIEELLTEQVGSRTGAEVSDFDCAGQGVDLGEQIRCTASFEDGTVEDLVVDVEGTTASPFLEVGLE